MNLTARLTTESDPGSELKGIITNAKRGQS